MSQLQTDVNLILVGRSALLNKMNFWFSRDANRLAIARQNPAPTFSSAPAAQVPKGPCKLGKKDNYLLDTDLNEGSSPKDSEKNPSLIAGRHYTDDTFRHVFLQRRVLHTSSTNIKDPQAPLYVDPLSYCTQRFNTFSYHYSPHGTDMERN